MIRRAGTHQASHLGARMKNLTGVTRPPSSRKRAQRRPDNNVRDERGTVIPGGYKGAWFSGDTTGN